MALQIGKGWHFCVMLLCVVAGACVAKPFPYVVKCLHTAAWRASVIVVVLLVVRILQWAWCRAGRHKLRASKHIFSAHVNGRETNESSERQAIKGCDLVFDEDAAAQVAEAQNRVIETVAVLGSGGHTEEMLHLLRGFNPTVYRIHFVLAKSDKQSLQRLEASAVGKMLEKTKLLVKYSELEEIQPSAATSQKQAEGKSATADLAPKAYTVTRIPRSREVGQSWFTSGFSFFHALLSCLVVIWTKRPRLVLLNGPGTCVPVAFAALLRELLSGKEVVLIYVESVCRVENLSLSGYILYPFVDKLFVQWPQLQRRYPECEYCGFLC